MKEILAYQRIVSAAVLLLAAVAAGAAWLWLTVLAGPLGILVGAAVGLLQFRLDSLAIVRAIMTQENEAQRSPVKSYFQGLLLFMAVMALALAKSDWLNPWCTLAGLLLPRFVLIADGLLRPAGLYVPAAGTPSTGETK